MQAMAYDRVAKERWGTDALLNFDAEGNPTGIRKKLEDQRVQQQEVCTYVCLVCVWMWPWLYQGTCMCMYASCACSHPSHIRYTYIWMRPWWIQRAHVCPASCCYLPSSYAMSPRVRTYTWVLAILVASSTINPPPFPNLDSSILPPKKQNKHTQGIRKLRPCLSSDMLFAPPIPSPPPIHQHYPLPVAPSAPTFQYTTHPPGAIQFLQLAGSNTSVLFNAPTTVTQAEPQIQIQQPHHHHDISSLNAAAGAAAAGGGGGGGPHMLVVNRGHHEHHEDPQVHM